MTRILRAVLSDTTIEVYVYSPDNSLNARVGKEIAKILRPEAARIWALRESSQELIGTSEEVSLIQVAVDDDGLIVVDASASLDASTATEVVEVGIRAFGGEDAVLEFRATNRPAGPTIH